MAAPRLLLLLLAALAGCGAPRGGQGRAEELRRRIEAVLARPELAGSTSGVEMRRLSDGSVIFEHGADRLLAPASTTKVVSCAGALAILGGDHRFTTRLVRTGELREGTLHGDLVLVASGDPNLSQRVTGDGKLLFTDNDHTYAGYLSSATAVPGDPLQVLAALAREARRAGVERVEGAVVVDDGLFRERSDEFVGPFSAACVNDGVVDVVVTPAEKAGEPPSLSISPARPAVQVECAARTIAPGETATDLRLEAAEDVGRFRLSGTVVLGAKPMLLVAQFPEPGLAAAHLLHGELVRAGIAVRDPPRRSAQGPAAHASAVEVAAHVSPPLSEAVKVILKVSHNLHATMLPVIVGALKAGSGDRFAGYRLIRELLSGAGVDAQAVVLRSGSGGGRADCLSARFLVSVLAFMARHAEAEAFYRALPIGGRDGTLAGHFRDPRFAGRVRAKTGTLVYQGALSGRWIFLSKALAGYLEPGARPEERRGPGEDAIVFAIITANCIAETRPQGSEALFRAQEDILAAALELYGASGGGAGSPETHTASTAAR